MLSPDIVRWISAGLFLTFVVSAGLFLRPRRATTPRVVRAARPLSVVTGPLWGFIIAVVLATPLIETIVPNWIYGGPFTVDLPLGSGFQVAGVLLWLSGGGLALWSIRTLGRFTRPEIEVLTDHELVTSGPYRWIRHPLYTAFLLISAGVALLLLNLVSMALFLGVLGIARARAMAEEALLASESGFGAAYVSYIRGTGRFLPRLFRRRRHTVRSA